MTDVSVTLRPPCCCPYKALLWRYSYLGPAYTFSVGKAENLLSGFYNRLQLDNQSRKHSVCIGNHMISSAILTK